MIEEVAKDKLSIRISPNRISMGADAAGMVGERLRNLLEKQDLVNVIFAAAPSQQEFLDHLIQEQNIEWKRVNAFHMDEYIGLDAEAPQLFGNFLKKRIFEKLPFREVFYFGSGSKNESQRYSDLLRSAPPDVVCMGIGENAHIAFNDPHVADFEDTRLVKVVELDPVCRQQQVNDGCFKNLEEVPEYALTLTIPALLEASFIFCMVPGANKARAVYNTLHRRISVNYPSSILRKHPNAILFLDKESSSQLELSSL